MEGEPTALLIAGCGSGERWELGKRTDLRPALPTTERLALRRERDSGTPSFTGEKVEALRKVTLLSHPARADIFIFWPQRPSFRLSWHLKSLPATWRGIPGSALYLHMDSVQFSELPVVAMEERVP